MFEQGSKERKPIHVHSRSTLLPAVGVLGVALVIAFSPLASAGAASVLRLKGATSDDSFYSTVNGCSKASPSISTLNPHSGLGRFKISTSAMNCRASAQINSSQTWVLSVLGDLIPVHLKAHPKGVSLGWSVQAKLSDSAVTRGSTSSCPIRYQNSTSFNGTTWFNQTYAYADCHVLGNVYVVSNAYLLDRTTGAYYFPTSSGPTAWSNESGYSATYTAFGWNYSNPSYWAYNFSYPGSWNNITYGGGGTLSISATPTYYFNGTFSGTDKYVLGFYIDNQVFSMQAFFRGTATASLNAATLGNHESITSMTVY